jgi:predicted  nucleic acid-binding Zn-ribbon protein
MESAFETLEKRVRKAADEVRRLRDRNRELEQELTGVRPRLADAEKQLQAAERQLKDAERSKGASAEEAKKLAGLEREVQALHKERDEIRTRIAALVEVLDGIE